ncbi:MAG: hypothetical protein JWN52_333 [Actinomycetia bacterium]|nr:hypothetical protein [Actinomycetes bacterium]
MLTGGDAEAQCPRVHLLDLLGQIRPWDEQELRHRDLAADWLRSGAPLYRVRDDEPPMHLVSYFLVLDEATGTLLLVEHRKASLLLPAGGHVEAGEDPWSTVVRECREELFLDAVPSTATGARPFFITATRTRGRLPHTDVSLWYVLRADAETITVYDEREFTGIRWLTPQQVFNEPLEGCDPHLHRACRKLLAARTS